MNNTPVILLHGLGSHPFTLWPLEKYLNWKGWKNTVHALPFEEVLDYVDQEICT